jgi:ferrous-iron efflux pump FieF
MVDKQAPLFIGNDRLRRLATLASLSVAAILIVAKFIAYLMTNSVALLSSLFDSVFDLIASLITAYGVASALRPPDREHRFGHGKAEPLAALVQSVFFVGSTLFLAYESITRLFHPQSIENVFVGTDVMVLAVVLTLALVLFQKYVVGKTGSTAISADRLHYVGDVAVNLAVIAAFALSRKTGLVWLDPLFAIGITIMLLLAAYKIFKSAMAALMDAELPQTEREKIRDIVLRQEGAEGLHDMRTRTDGDRVFIELHAEMNGDMTLSAAHDLAEKITAAVAAEFPNADILVHQDPSGAEEFRLDAQIEKPFLK